MLKYLIMDYLKLLIADDEENIRNGLKNILDWESLGIRFCGAAANGKEAFNQILDIQPDIVIMDIKMPGLSGIEVIEKVSQHCTEQTFRMPSFIVLSGFPDFEYAQKTMNAGAKAYLLKPVDEELLEKKVIEISAEIKKYKEQREGILQSKDFQEQSFVTKIIAGQNFSEDSLPDTKFFTDCEKSNYMCLCVMNSKIPENLKNDFYTGLEKSFSFFTKVIIKNNDDTLVFLKTSNDTAVMNCVSRICGGENYPSFMTSGGLFCGIKGIFSSYCEAKELLRYLFFFSEMPIINKNDVENYKKTNVCTQKISISEFVKNLLFCIETYDKNQMARNLEMLKIQYSDFSMSEGEIKKAVISILSDLRNSIVEKYPEREINNSHTLDFVPELLEASTYSYLIDFASSVAQDFLESFNFNMADSMIVKVISYVKSNYSKDLKLENLGELFNCNSAYLGKKFTKHTGVQFNTFLDNLRVEAAKEKLLNTDLKIYQISKLVGYNNTDYFFMKFKKNTGLTPKEFKLQAGKNIDEE